MYVCGTCKSICVVCCVALSLLLSHYNGVIMMLSGLPVCCQLTQTGSDICCQWNYWVCYYNFNSAYTYTHTHARTHTHYIILMYVHTYIHIICISRDPANESMTNKANPVGLNETKMQ